MISPRFYNCCFCFSICCFYIYIYYWFLFLIQLIVNSLNACLLVVNLAAALSQLSFSNSGRKLRVGLMDGDIYGPSIPTLMQLTGLEAKTSDNDDDGKGYCDYYY